MLKLSLLYSPEVVFTMHSFQTLVTLSLLTLPSTIFSAPAPAPAEGGILGHASDRTKYLDFTVRGVNDGDIDIDGGEVRFVNVPGGSLSAV